MLVLLTVYEKFSGQVTSQKGVTYCKNISRKTSHNNKDVHTYVYQN